MATAPWPVNGRPARTGVEWLLDASRARNQGDRLSPNVAACLPDRLHPVSQMLLDAFLEGRITRADFLWGFHLPNSDYLPVAQCVLHALTLGI